MFDLLFLYLVGPHLGDIGIAYFTFLLCMIALFMMCVCVCVCVCVCARVCAPTCVWVIVHFV